MLRITTMAEGPSSVRLKLEGRIVSEWVALLEQVCLQQLQEQRQIILDFAAVTFIDERGVQMLQRLTSPSVTIIHCPAFIADLLKLGK